MFDLTDKVCFVSGATRGIGKAIATQLGKQGATVIGTATSQAGADSISAHLADAGIQGRGLVLNVADGESIDAAMKAVTDEFGAISVLVNLSLIHI